MPLINYQKIKELMVTYSSTVGDPIVSLHEGKLKKMIYLLMRFRHHDEFYTVYNLKELGLTWDFAMDTYLGYDLTKDNYKDVSFYMGLIHPFVVEWATLYMAGMYKCLLENKFDSVDYLSFRYVINLPMRKANGTYMLVKQISMPFEFDNNGLMISHINSNFIVDKYKGEPLKPRLFHLGKRLREHEEILFKECLEFTNLIKQNCLSKELNNAAKLILEIPEKDKGNLPKELLSKINKVRPNEKKINLDTVYKTLERIKNNLVPVFEVDKNFYDKEKVSELQSYMPDLTDHWTLIKFAHESRVLNILNLIKKGI